MNRPCEYCGEDLPEGVDKRTRQIRSAHFAIHTKERREAEAANRHQEHEMITTEQALEIADKAGILNAYYGTPEALVRALNLAAAWGIDRVCYEWMSDDVSQALEVVSKKYRQAGEAK